MVSVRVLVRIRVRGTGSPLGVCPFAICNIIN